MTDDSTAPSSAVLEDWLVDRVAQYRERSADDIDADVPMAQLGLDSVYMLSLCGDFEDDWGLEVDPTTAWDHPTIRRLAGHLASELRRLEVGA